jgi:DNA-directed RNA polymerase beta subunit
VSGDDIIIGKTIPAFQDNIYQDQNNQAALGNQKAYKDQSIPLKHSEKGYID